MHRWPSEYRDPDGRVLDAPRDLGSHLEPGGSSHLVRVAVDRGGYAAGIATVGHVTCLRQRLGAMIPSPCPRSGSTRTASARRPDHVPGQGAAVRFRSAGIATRPSARSVDRSSAWLAMSNGADTGRS